MKFIGRCFVAGAAALLFSGLGISAAAQADAIPPAKPWTGQGKITFAQEVPPSSSQPSQPNPEPEPYPYPSETESPFIPDMDTVSPYDQNRDGCVSNAEIAATLNGMDWAGNSANDGSAFALLGAVALDLMLGTCADE
tara:strand:- start:1038 stop:1451 length:414 start_codon:yes stop_codon:yes gene_type:complete